MARLGARWSPLVTTELRRLALVLVMVEAGKEASVRAF
jgi:hypothetical protein